jgi:hypothetical protein
LERGPFQCESTSGLLGIAYLQDLVLNRTDRHLAYRNTSQGSLWREREARRRSDACGRCGESRSLPCTSISFPRPTLRTACGSM